MKVLLGICGGVAAYKAAELTRELQRRGAQVQVAMTAGALRFITPLTLAALSGRPVLGSLWEPSTPEVGSAGGSADGAAEEFDIEHIRVAQEIDALVIAPATAHMIARLAHGLADDLLSTICLATRKPVLLAPAMNVNMWQHPATQQNIALLQARGVRLIAPASGELACGMVGEGRLANPLEIADAVLVAVAGESKRTSPCSADAPAIADLNGETILITAGGTREPIDTVRYIGNRSSGKMGLGLAEASLSRGARVILITAAAGAVPSLPCTTIPVNTAAEMQQAVLEQLPLASIVVMAAAVSDYRVSQPAAQKLKKRETLTLELVPNDDILQRIVLERCPGTLVIGFAAETQNVLEEGRRKLREKGIDAIVANDVSQRDCGFEVDRNAGTLLLHGQEIVLPPSSKREMADRILDHLDVIRAAAAAHEKSAPAM